MSILALKGRLCLALSSPPKAMYCVGSKAFTLITCVKQPGHRNVMKTHHSKCIDTILEIHVIIQFWRYKHNTGSGDTNTTPHIFHIKYECSIWHSSAFESSISELCFIWNRELSAKLCLIWAIAQYFYGGVLSIKYNWLVLNHEVHRKT